jgi:hypothetical protein
MFVENPRDFVVGGDCALLMVTSSHAWLILLDTFSLQNTTTYLLISTTASLKAYGNMRTNDIGLKSHERPTLAFFVPR